MPKGGAIMRLTKAIRKKLLEKNDGLEIRSSYDSRNSEYERFYKIKDGELHIREIGKTSWADSRYDDEWIADEEQTHRFLYNYLCKLDTDGME